MTLGEKVEQFCLSFYTSTHLSIHLPTPPFIYSFYIICWMSVVCQVIEQLNIHLPLCKRYKRGGFDPWSGRSPGIGNGNPLPYSCLENSVDRGAQMVQFMWLRRVGHDRAYTQAHTGYPRLCLRHLRYSVTKSDKSSALLPFWNLHLMMGDRQTTLSIINKCSIVFRRY